jgi:hypothetical protein
MQKLRKALEMMQLLGGNSFLYGVSRCWNQVKTYKRKLNHFTAKIGLVFFWIFIIFDTNNLDR